MESNWMVNPEPRSYLYLRFSFQMMRSAGMGTLCYTLNKACMDVCVRGADLAVVLPLLGIESVLWRLTLLRRVSGVLHLSPARGCAPTGYFCKV